MVVDEILHALHNAVFVVIVKAQMLSEATLTFNSEGLARLSSLVPNLINYGLDRDLANFIEVGKLEIRPEGSRTASASGRCLKLTSHRQLHELISHSVYC